MLAEAGLPVVEATSFVSPRAFLSSVMPVRSWQVSHTTQTQPFPSLFPILKGWNVLITCGVRSIAVFTAASESFTHHNINATIAESLANFRPVVALAQREHIPVRGYISTVFGCPYEGVY